MTTASRPGPIAQPPPAPPALPALPALTVAAWFTHVYTATGAVLSFLSVVAVIAGDIRAAFFWFVVAVVVDSTDGFLARSLHISERVPSVDGRKLDDIVDYLTYVFVPSFLLYHTGRLPAGWGLAVVFAVLVVSVMAFAKSDAKTDDHFFTGFPSYWNVVAFYLYALKAAPEFNAAVLLVLCVLVFVRVGYVYPSQTKTLRPVTVLFASAWAILILYLVWQLPSVNRTLLLVSLAFPAYYTVLSLVLHARRPGA